MTDPLPIMADRFKNKGKSIMNYDRTGRSVKKYVGSNK